MPSGDLQPVVMNFEIVDDVFVQEDLSFVLRASSASANVIGAIHEVQGEYEYATLGAATVDLRSARC